MTEIGAPGRALRVAIVGSGPGGFYTAQQLFNDPNLRVEADVFDRLPSPYGLVRLGVAPDHQKIKRVIRVYEGIAATPGFRFFGNVEIGRHLTVEELRRYYHQIVYCTGAQTDRSLGIPGEALVGSHTATEFVAWYNGHPDFRDRRFDLSQTDVLVVGVGNVAVDVARILCRTPQELERTDIADYALAALRESRVLRVIVVGRRGPAQAAFSLPELEELAQLPGAECSTLPAETELDALSRHALDKQPGQTSSRKTELLQRLAERRQAEKPRKLCIRFLLSPVEILGDAHSRVRAVKLERNELFAEQGGAIKSRGVGEFETLQAGLVFRSVGYRGVPIPGVPFREDWATVPHDRGRVIEAVGGEVRRGEYVAGWIKRGAQGLIGTNKADARETVMRMLEDVREGRTLRPESPSPQSVVPLILERQPDVFDYEDWRRLDQIEVQRGKAAGRPRLKFTALEPMLAALGRR